MENPLLMIGGDFEFYFSIFGDESFVMEMNFPGIFLIEDEFLADFSNGERVPPGLIQGCIAFERQGYKNPYNPSKRERTNLCDEL